MPLAEQDRSRWDTGLIAEGVTILQAALARDRLGEYQAQAAIAALHADAPTTAETDWVQIVEWYDELLRLTGSPVVRLNRAVAVGEADGPRAGLAALADVEPDAAPVRRGDGLPARTRRRPRDAPPSCTPRRPAPPPACRSATTSPCSRPASAITRSVRVVRQSDSGSGYRPGWSVRIGGRPEEDHEAQCRAGGHGDGCGGRERLQLVRWCRRRSGRGRVRCFRRVGCVGPVGRRVGVHRPVGRVLVRRRRSGGLHDLPRGQRLARRRVEAAGAPRLGGLGGQHRGVRARPPDFGAGLIDGAPFGIPVTTVGAGQATVKVTFDYADESDKGPYPVPRNARVEGGPNADGDRHVIVHDTAACKAYELYDAHPNADGSWKAGSGAVFDLRRNDLRKAGWTSADAAGLSILAGLPRADEVAAGRIDHAIRVTAPRTKKAYVWPARHAASSATDAALPPMGARFRLKASVDISKFPPQSRVIAQALKQYGAILADNGFPWFFSGTQDDRWNNDQLNALKGLSGKDFEAVDGSLLMVDANSARCRP